MSDTIPNLPVTALYQSVSATTTPSIPTGTLVRIQNLGQVDVRYQIAATAPIDDSGFNRIKAGECSSWVEIAAGENDIFYRCAGGDGLINVQTA